ncbi:hypothetical protein GCM10009555_007620 [Acrocarpospora macrocephala]|uniref:PPM-type phosphatase domain-containing protein n=1 Tax=Acrocarpospora macrocephala TaxID=150177 RepID=A0A5M3X4C3_9ACTN|nr:protein phosphatase 2C domain-containing protein [Acrocarpospora macrocephala]GES12968.1 hypothetical protein Amac_065650 [Acrocarpospora macrocephala]
MTRAEPVPPAFVRDEDTTAPTVGRAAHGFRASLDPANPLRVPSVVADAGQLGPYWVAAAALTGLSHLHLGTTGQDRYSFHADASTQGVAVTVADGLGSRPRTAQLGADTLARTLSQALAATPGTAFGSDPRPAVAAAVAIANERLCDTADPRGPENLASVFAAARLPESGGPLILARVGDCSAFGLGPDGFFPIFGEKDGALNEPGAYLPADDPLTGLELRTVPAGGCRALVLATDGLAEDLRGSPAIRDWLAARWERPCHTMWMLNSLRYRRQGSHDDRTALVVWFPPFE